MAPDASEAGLTEQDQQILSFIDSRREDLIALACELIATPSITPPGDERQVVALLLKRLPGLGLDGAQVVGPKPERPSLLYRLRGRSGRPTLLYNGHIDTKPVGEEAARQWRTDPLRPTILDGRLYGLGSADMKGAVAAMVYAASALKQIVPQMEGDLLLALSADEEGGGSEGAGFLCRGGYIKADFGLIGEPSGVRREWEYIQLVSRGICFFRTKVYGTQMHSSISNILPSVNASVKMAQVMVRFSRDLTLSHRPHPLCPFGVTVNPGVMVRGGVFYGVNPGYAEFATDIRVIPGMTLEGVRRDLEAFLDDLRAEDSDLKVELEFESPQPWIPPTEIAPENPLVQALVECSRAVLGQAPPLGAYPATTDSPKFQLEAGVPTVPSFGPGIITLAHGPNEWVGVESIVQAAKIYALAARRLLT